jgi:hypothetical protein
MEVNRMAKKAKGEKVIQSTMRIPASLWKELNRIADRKRLSQNQAVVVAVEEYIQREGRQ